MPKTIVYVLALVMLLFTNSTALAIGDCTNLMKNVDSKNADMFKMAKISLSCNSNDELVCKQNSRTFSCEDIKSKLNENSKVFKKYHLVEFIDTAKWNTPAGYQKKLRSKPIYLGKKDTKAFCSFIETENTKPCINDLNDSEPVKGTVNDLWFSFRFILDHKKQAYVYAYETTELDMSISCDLTSNDTCTSADDSSYSQDLMKKGRLLSLINKKR